MRFDPINSFFGLSVFKQLFTILLLGPVAASVWGLIADWKHARVARAVRLVPGISPRPSADESTEDVHKSA